MVFFKKVKLNDGLMRLLGRYIQKGEYYYMKTMGYKRILTLLGCCILFLGTAGYIVKANSTEKKTASIQTDQTYPNVEIQTLVKDLTDGGYAISYPSFGKKEIDQYIQAYVTDQVAHYEKKLKKLSKKKKSELTITYKIVHYSKQTLSIVFDEYESVNGEKGTSSLKTFTFDLPAQKQMTLKNLFKEDANYLDRLSAISYAELKKQMKTADFDPDLQKGTQAANQNFSQFALLENSIVIYFKPYQLGAEQMKTKTIAIQKDLFKDMLSDAYKDEAVNKNKVKETPPKHIVNEMPQQGAPIDPTKKVVAMTFDDGPNPSSTNVILDGLKEMNGHATFFVLGSRVQYYPETIERMVKEGNEVGNHSWDHPQLTRLNEAQVKHQIGDTQALIKQVSGYEPLHVRPPYGAVNANVRRYIGNVGVTLWDIDPEDWKYRNVPHSVQAVMSQVGDGKVILMHDIYQTSAEAAVEIMKQLHAQGYQLVTISQLEQVKKEREQLHVQ